MGNKLEQLLNTLIQRGWKPFGKTGINERDGFVYMNKGHCIRLHKGVYADNMLCGEYDLRQIVSKESGLWQFVCENKLENPKERKQWTDLDGEDREYVKYSTKFYEYRLIETALTDEDKLEQFLLDNIHIDE